MKVAFDHAVQNGEQLPHGGDQGNHFGFSGLHETLVEGSDDGIVTGGDESAHVECRADRRAAAFDNAMTAESTRVLVDGSDTDQGGDLTTVQGA